MTTLGTLDAPTLLGVLGMLVALTAMIPLVNYIRSRIIVSRAHAGTSTFDDVDALIWSKRHKANINQDDRVRLLCACDPKRGTLTENEAREWAEDPFAFGDVDKKAPYHPAVVARWLIDGHDINFLFTCFDAGLSSNELLDHCDNINPITPEQAQMLAAFRYPSPDDSDGAP
jgi:hypothetical protein